MGTLGDTCKAVSVWELLINICKSGSGAHERHQLKEKGGSLTLGERRWREERKGGEQRSRGQSPSEDGKEEAKLEGGAWQQESRCVAPDRRERPEGSVAPVQSPCSPTRQGQRVSLRTDPLEAIGDLSESKAVLLAKDGQRQIV